MRDQKRREDIRHQIDFLHGQSLRSVWDVVQAEVALLPVFTWSRRGRDFKGSPVDFVRNHYGTTREDRWEAGGLTINDLGRDAPLLKAYRRWVRLNPEDDLHLSDAAPPPQQPQPSR